MSEGAATPAPKKAKGTKKQKSASNHPKYLEMAMSAIGQLGERNGSSRQAIHKYIMGKYNVGKDPKIVNTHLKMALKRGVTTGVLKHVKGQGASGSFRLMSAEKKLSEKKPVAVKAKPKAVAATKAKKPKVSKPAKKPVPPKKKKAVAAPAKPKPKPAAKKAKKVTKPAKPKTSKPKAVKKPAAKAAKAPKKAKTSKKGKK